MIRKTLDEESRLLLPSRRGGRQGKRDEDVSPFKVSRGHPLPLGSDVKRDGVNFAVFTRHATAVTLVIFPAFDSEETIEFALDPRYNRTGDVWHAFVSGLNPGAHYGFRADR